MPSVNPMFASLANMFHSGQREMVCFADSTQNADECSLIVALQQWFLRANIV